MKFASKQIFCMRSKPVSGNVWLKTCSTITFFWAFLYIVVHYFPPDLHGSVHVVGDERCHEGGGEDGALVVAVHAEPAGHVGAQVAAEADAEAVVVGQEGPGIFGFF